MTCWWFAQSLYIRSIVMLRRAALLHFAQDRHVALHRAEPPLAPPPPEPDCKRRKLNDYNKPSRSGHRLFTKVSSGRIHAIDAIRTARDIVADYGDHHDLVSGWASLAANGSRPQHAHRDLTRWVRTLGVDLDTAYVDVTYKNLADHGTASGKHTVLYPHEVFAAIYASGMDNFEKAFLGSAGVAGIAAFWEQQSNQTWVEQHPSLQHVDSKFAIPLGFHADKGRHITRDKLLTISWGSVLSEAATIWSKILFTVLPDELEIKQATDEQLYAVLV